MENTKLLELPKLIDLLAEQTTVYMKMVSKGATKEEFENCQTRLRTLQREIELRRGKKNTSDPEEMKRSV